jgi:hypothetical protein
MRMVSRTLSGVMLVLSTASIPMAQLAVAQIGSGGGIVSLFGGLAVSPDGKSLIFDLNELNESYIMVMKNFR